jgi:hypothetical protein
MGTTLLSTSLVQAGRPTITAYWQLLIQYILNYLLYLVAAVAST